MLFPSTLSLAPAVSEILEGMVRRTSTPQIQALRAKALLAMALGGTNPEIAAWLGLHPTSVRKLRQCWLDEVNSLEPPFGW